MDNEGRGIIMKQEYIKNNLVIKKIEIEHLSQFNNLLRYVFQVTNNTLSEVGWEDFEIQQEKLPTLKKAEVLGWFDGDKLVSQIAVYPLKVNIHGRLFKMGGVTGVGTYPEYSGMGLIKEIMLQSLEEMREKGQTISYLFPYSIPYYRKKGWEIISDVMTFSLKDSQLPKKVEVDGIVQRVDLEHEDVKQVYNRFAKLHHAALIRGSLEWGEYWRWEKEEMVAAVYYDSEQVPQGYLLYWVENDIFYIKEMIYLLQEARHGLWNFINAHFSMISEVKGKTFRNESIAFLLEDSEIVETIRPYYMARIVDVKAFLEKFPFNGKSEPFYFVVQDSLLEWNRGIFSLSWDEKDNVIVTKEAIGKEVKLNINTLTTMLMSYRSPSYLKEIGRIQSDNHTIKELEKIIPSNIAYFSDFF